MLRRFVSCTALFLTLTVPTAFGQGLEPPADRSDNVTWKATLPEPNVISARFRDGKMYVSTLRGRLVYDIADPEAPKQIGSLELPHFENEDVDLGGDILLISNDPSEGQGILYLQVRVPGRAEPRHRREHRRPHRSRRTEVRGPQVLRPRVQRRARHP